MITSEDIQMSKMSFTNKDFGTIYPSLLDLAKQLTSKWDPSQSNESDPGVVLLKEGAFIADHTNYNIDKNVLENFLPSATQETSVRNIVDMNGYNPRYYVSATGDVSFTYNADEDETFVGFNIPAFTMQVSNDDESVVYTQLSNLSISADGLTSKCLFIEGTLNSLTVNNSTTILLENLDSNNRVYFPVSYVAQNGIFISTVDNTSDYWARTDYLLTQPLGSYVYKVGYDSQLGKPYVEFPTDIANIIGSGLIIKYITTSGKSGNISSNTITKIVSATTYTTSGGVEVDLTKFSLSNYSSFINGKDPETIDEMYDSFKKIVGTFDTLVTRQDYQNAINSLEDSVTGNKLISNSTVTDISTDYNHALNIVTYDQYGVYYENASITSFRLKFNASRPSPAVYGDIYISGSTFKLCKDNNSSNDVTVTGMTYDEFTTASSAMTSYDLYVFMLKAYSSNQYKASKPWLALNNSYSPADAATTVKEVKSDLEEYKCINHNFKDPVTGDVLMFKNYAPLYVTITPYSKVTLTEKNDIVSAVYKAISDNFNASKLEFGLELNYDTIVDTLLNCDDRIKNIRLENINYTTKAVVKTDSGYSEYSLLSDESSEYTTDLLVDLIAKNVLAGRLCLFQFDDEFVCEYGLVVPTDSADLITTDVEAITTETTLPITTTVTATGESLDTNIYLFSSTSSANILITLTGDSATISAGDTYTASQSGVTFKVGYNLNSSGVASREALYSYTDANNYFTVKNTSSATITLTSGTAVSVAKDAILVNVVSKSTGTLGTTRLDSALADNEYIHIAYQSYSTDTIYPTYVNYRFISTDTSAKIPLNTDYKLLADENLILMYTSNSVEQTVEYQAGDVIKANFDIPVTTTGTVKVWTDQYGYKHNNDTFKQLGANEQIEHRVKMQTLLTHVATPCYWIRSNTDNNLFPNTVIGSNTTVLGSGEYFIYTNSNKDTLVILGAGTKLTGYASSTTEWCIDEKPSISDIESDGLSSNIQWQYKDFSQHTFTILEQALVTLGKGDSVEFYDWSNPPTSIDNDWVTCTGSIKYTLSDGTVTTLPQLQDGYLVRSRLDLAVSSETGQTLTSTQHVYLNNGSSSEVDLTNCCMKTSSSINTYGDTQIDISNLLNTTISVEKYSKSDPYYTVSGLTTQHVLESVNGKISIVPTANLSAYMPFIYKHGAYNYILPIYADLADNHTTTVTALVLDASSNAKSIKEYNSDSSSVSTFTFTTSGMYLILLPANSLTTTPETCRLLITVSNYNSAEETVITVYSPVVYTGLNNNLAYTGVTLSDVADKIKSLVANSTKSSVKPYYINEPELSVAMQDDNIADPNILWDINNVANYLTIAQIDIPNSNIDIIKSMRDY